MLLPCVRVVGPFDRTGKTMTGWARWVLNRVVRGGVSAN